MLLLVILVATFIVPLNSTMITVTLPTLSRVFSVGVSQVNWLVSIYFIVMAFGQPLGGKLADNFGF